MRYIVTRSHSIGSFPPVPYHVQEIAASTLDKWIRWEKKKDSCSVRDNRVNGVGDIAFHYYHRGCPNNTVFTIQPA